MLTRPLVLFVPVILFGTPAVRAQTVSASLLSGTPVGFAVNPVTNRVYVANQATNTVTIIDGATNITTTVPSGLSYVALHGHSEVNSPNEFSTAVTVAKGMSFSKYFKVNLEVGFSAADLDAVAYITEIHEHITHLDIEDRKKNDGSNEQYGDGDTIKPVLALSKRKSTPFEPSSNTNTPDCARHANK